MAFVTTSLTVGLLAGTGCVWIVTASCGRFTDGDAEAVTPEGYGVGCPSANGKLVARVLRLSSAAIRAATAGASAWLGRTVIRARPSSAPCLPSGYQAKSYYQCQ
jgi:hypothetical protein